MCKTQSDTTASLTPRCICQECFSLEEPRVVKAGDIVTLQLNLQAENGWIPEPLFDTQGIVQFVVGWGNYLPGLHELVMGKSVGQSIHNAIDAGWGARKPDLVMELAKSKLKRFMASDGSFPKEGSVLKLQGGSIQLEVVEVKENTVIVDANPPLAGASYDCSFVVLAIDELPSDAAHLDAISKSQTQQTCTPSSKYQVATWALGCFWGGELAFMRVPGVVGTRVGYTQGIVPNPSYEDVCTGKTQHREAILVVYDSSQVTYQQLMEIAIARLAATNTPQKNQVSQQQAESDMFGNLFAEPDDNMVAASRSQQYRHGFYYHSEEQRHICEEKLQAQKNPYQIEVRQAAAFFKAEDSHQQYLLKGGQSARKGAKDPIRCYG